MDQYRALLIVSVATVIRVLEPEEKATFYDQQYYTNWASFRNLKDMLMDTYSRLNLLQLYCIPYGAGMRWFVAVPAMCSKCGNFCRFSIA